MAARGNTAVAVAGLRPSPLRGRRLAHRGGAAVASERKPPRPQWTRNTAMVAAWTLPWPRQGYGRSLCGGTLPCLWWGCCRVCSGDAAVAFAGTPFCGEDAVMPAAGRCRGTLPWLPWVRYPWLLWGRCCGHVRCHSRGAGGTLPWPPPGRCRGCSGGSCRGLRGMALLSAVGTWSWPWWRRCVRSGDAAVVAASRLP